MAKDLEYYTAQLRRIEEHREQEAEKAIRKLYKDMMKDLQHFIADEYVQLAQDGKLTYEILHGKNRYAKFLEEVEKHLNGISSDVSKEIQKTVEEIYKLGYEGMADAVKKSTTSEELHKALKSVSNVTPEVVKAAVNNPISGLTLSDTLEKNRKEIIYDVKQQIGIGLTQGDRMSTMARRISKSLDGDYKKAVRIVRTEVHRVREAGHLDSCVEIENTLEKGTSGMQLVKVWRTMKDERVRPNVVYKTKSGWKHSKSKSGENHVQMEEQMVLVKEAFSLSGGAKAMAPGQSGVAGHDINCRCLVEYVLMDDAEYFAKTGKHFAVNPEKKLLDKEYLTRDKIKAAEKRRDNAELEMQSLDSKEFANIWKNPVTAKDYESLKDRLPAKRAYFEANNKKMLSLCDEFEDTGKKYLKAKKVLEQADEKLAKLKDELKDTRQAIMKIRGIDPKKMQDEINDLKAQIAKMQGSGVKVTLKSKVGDYDTKVLEQALKETDDWYKNKSDDYFDSWLGSWSGDSVKEFMESNLEPEYHEAFKQTLKKLVTQPNIDEKELKKLQKALESKEKELAKVMKRYGLEDDKFSQKRKEAAYKFEDRKKADSVLRPATSKLWKSASDAEKRGAYDYTGGSGKYNRPLRGYDGSWYNFKGVGKVDLDNEGAGQRIKDLTTMIDKNSMDYDIWLFRGVESRSGAAGFLQVSEDVLDLGEDELKQLLIGKVVKDEAFVSTGAAKGTGFSGPLMLNIYAPKGTKAVYAEPFSAFSGDGGLYWDGVKGQSYFGSEFEVIVQRGTSFKVINLEKKYGTIYMDVDIVGQ